MKMKSEEKITKMEGSKNNGRKRKGKYIIK